jgi:hypothetical protein
VVSLRTGVAALGTAVGWGMAWLRPAAKATVRRMLDSIVAECGVLLEKQSRRWCWT